MPAETLQAQARAVADAISHRGPDDAWRLPLPLKIQGGTGKLALDQILACHVQPALTDRPKAGFASPLGLWLRGPL